MTPPHLVLYSRQRRRKLVVAFVGVCGHAPVEAPLKLRLVQYQQAVNSHGVVFRGLDVLAHRLAVHAEVEG